MRVGSAPVAFAFRSVAYINAELFDDLILDLDVSHDLFLSAGFCRPARLGGFILL